jgi:hypothetical protein
MTNLSRAIVLFTLAGLSSVFFYPALEYTLLFWFMLILDSVGFILLLISRVPLKQFGYVWVGMMSILLMFYTSGYLGTTYFNPDVIMILLLSIIQLLALVKIGINTYANASLGDEAL